MSRLTERVENGFYKLKSGQEIYGEENGIRLVQIIGQYEDIDDNPEHLAEVNKAFKIVKNKKVQVALLQLCNSCVGYNMTRGLLGEDLTQEEFDLLKKVLL